MNMRSKTVIGPKYKKYQHSLSNPINPTPYVWCQVEVKRISDLDSKRMTIDVDFVLLLDWYDPSIRSEDKVSLNLEDNHFSPYVRIHNCREAQVAPIEQSSNRVHSFEKCHVKRTERYRCTLQQSLDLSNYPFDKHHLVLKLKGDHIRLRSNNLEHRIKDDEMCPRGMHAAHSISKDSSFIVGWSISQDKRDTREGDAEDKLNIHITVKRDPFGILMVLVVPLLLSTVPSLSSFWLSTSDLSNRIQIIITTLLAEGAFYQQARGHIPSNFPHATILDKYMICTLVILVLQAAIHTCFAAFGDSAVSNACLEQFEWKCQKYRNDITSIHLAFRLRFFAMLVVVTMLFWWRKKYVSIKVAAAELWVGLCAASIALVAVLLWQANALLPILSQIIEMNRALLRSVMGCVLDNKCEFSASITNPTSLFWLHVFFNEHCMVTILLVLLTIINLFLVVEYWKAKES